jgi:hypothetical protein
LERAPCPFYPQGAIKGATISIIAIFATNTSANATASIVSYEKSITTAFDGNFQYCSQL